MTKPQEWQDVIEAITTGDLVVLPTDTVYGIGCDPYSTSGVAKLLSAKGRQETMPPPVLAADWRSALAMADWTRLPTSDREQLQKAVEVLAREFWPGALTIIVPTSENLGWDMTKRNHTVALRVPDEPLTRALLEIAGPLAVTSANLTGKPPALTVKEARAFFSGKVRCYIDGGPSRVGEASTIIDATTNPIKAIRIGALDWDEIQRTLEDIEVTDLDQD